MNSESQESVPVMMSKGEKHSGADWTKALGLPCRIRFSFSIQGFTIGQLLGLEVGTVVTSRQPEGSPVRVEVNGRAIGYAEIEPSEGTLGFRITELD